MAAVGELEIADDADLIARLAALDMAFGDERMPFVVAVKVAGVRPDLFDRQIDDGC